MALEQQAAPRNGLRFDRTVSIATIGALVVYFAVGVRWVTDVDNAQAGLDRRVTALESGAVATLTDRTKIAVLESNLAALKEQVAESRKVLDEIRALLIQERSGGVRRGQ
jgi:hypothetical protein